MTETGCRSSDGCIDHNPLTRWQRIAYHMHVFRRSRATRLVSAPSARPGKLAQMPPYICFPGVGESGRRDGTSSRLHPSMRRVPWHHPLLDRAAHSEPDTPHRVRGLGEQDAVASRWTPLTHHDPREYRGTAGRYGSRVRRPTASAGLADGCIQAPLDVPPSACHRYRRVQLPGEESTSIAGVFPRPHASRLAGAE